MTSDQTPRLPGWYPDPVESGQKKYWNGQAWSDLPSLRPVVEMPPKPRRGIRYRTVWLVFTAAGVIAAIIGAASRSTTRLDSSVPGTQQAWVDYIRQANPAVQTLNDLSSSRAAVLSALATIATSPDPALNTEARDAITHCSGGDRAQCASDLRLTALAYNRSLNQAVSEHLATIQTSAP